MFKANDPANFEYRVKFAASVISARRTTTRTFDSCFENDDGDEVATMLVRRARRRPNTVFAQYLFHYIDEKTATAAAEELAHVSSKDMPAHAAATRGRNTRAQTTRVRRTDQNTARKRGMNIQHIKTRPNGYAIFFESKSRYGKAELGTTGTIINAHKHDTLQRKCKLSRDELATIQQIGNSLPTLRSTSTYEADGD